MNYSYYILDGEATVKCKKDGRRLATISPHCFIGELSFLLFVQDIKYKRGEYKGGDKSEPHNLASANVYANKTVHMQVWDFRELSKVLANDRDLSNAFASYCSHDLREKLLQQTQKAKLNQHKQKSQTTFSNYLNFYIALTDYSPKVKNTNWPKATK